MTPAELIALNIGLEYQVTGDGLLVPLPDSSEQARCVIHEHIDGYELYLRYDLLPALQARLLALPRETIFNDHETVKGILAPCERMWVGKSYFFVRDPWPGEYQNVEQMGNNWVIKVDGAVASVAWTVRGNDRAEEVAVETSESFRGRGYARQVVSAWAHSVLSKGRVAFYSHNWDNLASEALAHSLGLVQYTDGVAYE